MENGEWIGIGTTNPNFAFMFSNLPSGNLLHSYGKNTIFNGKIHYFNR